MHARPDRQDVPVEDMGDLVYLGNAKDIEPVGLIGIAAVRVFQVQFVTLAGRQVPGVQGIGIVSFRFDPAPVLAFDADGVGTQRGLFIIGRILRIGGVGCTQVGERDHLAEGDGRTAADNDVPFDDQDVFHLIQFCLERIGAGSGGEGEEGGKDPQAEFFHQNLRLRLI